MNEKEFRNIKTNVERARADRSKAEGAYDQLMKTLLEDHGCKTLDEAEDVLDEKQKELKELEAKYEEVLADFKEDWPDLFD